MWTTRRSRRPTSLNLTPAIQKGRLGRPFFFVIPSSCKDQIARLAELVQQLYVGCRRASEVKRAAALLVVGLFVSLSPLWKSSASDVAMSGSAWPNVNFHSRYVWRATMETGNILQWYWPSTSESGHFGGGVYNSGDAKAVATKEIAHSGRWSAKLTVATLNSSTSGARLFRWLESQTHRALYYSVWVYLPVAYKRTGNFFNLIQFKSSTPDGGRNDPVWAFYVENVGDRLYIAAGWGAGNTNLPGPYSGDGMGAKSYSQSIRPLPIRHWVHLEAFLRQSSAFDGQLTLWQDGVKLFDFQNIRTSYVNCTHNSWCANNAWSVNLYSDGLLPNPAVMYVDDAAIATSYIR